MEAKVEKKPTMAIRSKKYAELAYPLIEKIKGTETEAKYRTLALTFPTMIMQSGLAQAIGFLMAKDEAHHQKMLAHHKTLLNDNNLNSQGLQSDITTYQQLTRDAIEATSWLKRYTQALLDKQS